MDLLKRLGVDGDVAEDATSFVSPPAIAIRPIRNHSRQSFGIMTLPCNGQDQSFLYLLGKDGHSQWHVVDSAWLDCFGTIPTFSLLSFVPGDDDV
ncbi:MAG TPA: hypothetical protein VMU57_16605, partial [Edaphobacter sp.]|uniref:hypothetical protein n=1 Tax=Edaphobacter sp. TaxID=1934404 RepID=UPI002CE31545